MDRPTGPGSHLESGADLGVVDALAQLSFLVWGTLANLASQHDLSMIQTRLLGVLRDREPGMNELARLLELDKSSVTGLVDRAEKRGLVRRAVSTEDRRAIHVSLTKLGRTMVDQVAGEFEVEITGTLAGLSDTDRTMLSSLASRIVVAHSADRGVDLLDVAKPF
jgi:DNA-binding MarR family transcriptional regulator